MPFISLYTLGCKLNQLESEALADAFIANGFSLLCRDKAGAVPDIIIINTCTVTSRSDQKARRVIRKALADYPDSPVIVTGCYAKLDREKILALDTAADSRRLFASGGKSRLLDLPVYLRAHTVNHIDNVRSLVAAWFENEAGREGPCNEISDTFSFKPQRFSFHTRGFLKIQDGCNNRCTYCRIRLARGASVSLGADKALAELQSLEKQGYWEAVLTGVNISQYQDEALSGAQGLGGLLDYLLANTQSIGIRLSSLEPETITGDFAAVLAHPRIRPHFHLSVQSGSNSVLQRMGRSYTAASVERCAAMLRSVKRNPFLACDIITGFPGESEADFEDTRALCSRAGFAWIHAFPYSKRPGTAACALPQTVTERDAAQRVACLNALARQGRQSYAASCLGSTVEALVEKSHEAKAGYCRGISGNYLKLLIQCPQSNSPAPGAVVSCTISELTGLNHDEDSIDAIARINLVPENN